MCALQRLTADTPNIPTRSISATLKKSITICNERGCLTFTPGSLSFWVLFPNFFVCKNRTCIFMHKPIRNGLVYFPIGSQCGLITKLREIFVNLSQFLVPEIGLEPIRFVQPRDFKSLASAYSAIRAYLFVFCIKFHMQGILSPLRLPVSPYSRA